MKIKWDYTPVDLEPHQKAAVKTEEGRAMIGVMSKIQRSLLYCPLLLCSISALHSPGCTPDYVVRTHPVVYFRQSGRKKGARTGESLNRALIISGKKKGDRIELDGRPRIAPFLCSAEPVAIDMSGDKSSIEERIRKLAFVKGSKRVYLVDEKGEFITRGRLCFFPTFETQDKEILEGYEFRVPFDKIAKMKSGKRGLMFQAYSPLGSTNPSLKHIAWVFYIRAQ